MCLLYSYLWTALVVHKDIWTNSIVIEDIVPAIVITKNVQSGNSDDQASIIATVENVNRKWLIE